MKYVKVIYDKITNLCWFRTSDNLGPVISFECELSDDKIMDIKEKFYPHYEIKIVKDNIIHLTEFENALNEAFEDDEIENNENQ